MTDAFHLPGLDASAVHAWRTIPETDLRYPELDAEQLRRVIAHVRSARDRHLVEMPVEEIVRAIDAAAGRLADRSDPYRRMAEQHLPGLTRSSPEMVRLVLARMADDWRRPSLERLLTSELEDPGVLDSFRRRRTGGWVRALGPELAFHVLSGNVLGVGVTSLVRALLVKSASIAKCGSGEPLLTPLFARVLHEVAPDLADCIAVTYWTGGSREVEEVALSAADALIYYGGREGEASLRARVPAGVRFVAHGARVSFGIVGPEALTELNAESTAEACARAVAVFDQQGCVSPHLLYVLGEGEVGAEQFAELLAAALERLERELPRGPLTLEEQAAVHRERAAAEFRGLAGARVRMHAGEGTGYTVVFDADPTFVTSCLNRYVLVKPLDGIAALPDLLRPHADWLQSAGVTGLGGQMAGVAELLARSGVTRVSTFDRLPWPPAEWHHDGSEPLRELITWIDLED